MKKSSIPAAFGTNVAGNIVSASYNAMHKGRMFGTMCKINKVTGDVSVAMPPDFSKMQPGQDARQDQQSMDALRLLTEALHNPDREFVVVNGYELELAQDLLRSKAGILRVENLDLLSIALGTNSIN